MPTAYRVLENQGHAGGLSVAVFTLEFSGLSMSLIFFLHSHSVLQKHFIQITVYSSIFNKAQKKMKQRLAP